METTSYAAHTQAFPEIPNNKARKTGHLCSDFVSSKLQHLIPKFIQH